MSSREIIVDLANIEAVIKWPRSTTVIEVWSFLGLAGYYRRFVQDFSKISSTLTQLTEKEKPFVWTSTCEQSFQELKERLVMTLVLTVPDGSGNPVVYSDTSRKGLGVHSHVEGFKEKV